jgi:hypothetical protein
VILNRAKVEKLLLRDDHGKLTGLITMRDIERSRTRLKVRSGHRVAQTFAEQTGLARIETRRDDHERIILPTRQGIFATHHAAQRPGEASEQFRAIDVIGDRLG